MQENFPDFWSKSILTSAQWPGWPAVEAGTPRIRCVRAPMLPIVPQTPPSFHIIWIEP